MYFTYSIVCVYIYTYNYTLFFNLYFTIYEDDSAL
jgi:hypothetical protein